LSSKPASGGNRVLRSVAPPVFMWGAAAGITAQGAGFLLSTFAEPLSFSTPVVTALGVSGFVVLGGARGVLNALEAGVVSSGAVTRAMTSLTDSVSLPNVESLADVGNVVRTLTSDPGLIRDFLRSEGLLMGGLLRPFLSLVMPTQDAILEAVMQRQQALMDKDGGVADVHVVASLVGSAVEGLVAGLIEQLRDNITVLAFVAFSVVAGLLFAIDLWLQRLRRESREKVNAGVERTKELGLAASNSVSTGASSVAQWTRDKWELAKEKRRERREQQE